MDPTFTGVPNTDKGTHETRRGGTRILGTGADATLVTLNPDGSPQVSVVWVALQSTPGARRTAQRASD